MSISELSIKVEDLETLITSVKETSFHNTTLIMTILAFAVAVLSLLGTTVIQNLIKEKFSNFYETNMESLKAEIRIETKKELSKSEFQDDLTENIKESLYLDITERFVPTLISRSITVEGHSPISFSKVYNAYILIDGSIIIHSPNVSVFTLPTSYRPLSKKKIMTLARRVSDGYLYPVEIEINTKGSFLIVSKMHGSSEIHLNMEMLSIK